MTLQGVDLLPVQRINVDRCVLRTSSQVAVSQKLNAENGVFVVSFYSFQTIEPDVFTPTSDTDLFIGPHDAQLIVPLDLLAGLEIFDGPVFSLEVGGIMNIEGSHLGRVAALELSEHGLGVFHLPLVLLHQRFWGDDVFL